MPLTRNSVCASSPRKVAAPVAIDALTGLCARSAPNAVITAIASPSYSALRARRTSSSGKDDMSGIPKFWSCSACSISWARMTRSPSGPIAPAEAGGSLRTTSCLVNGS